MSRPPPIAPGLMLAARALLERPLMTERHDAFHDTWKWRRELQRLYLDLTGWTIQIGPGLLRLCAHAPFPDAGRAVPDLGSPRAAALLVWTLWYHETLGARIGEARQFTLEELAEAVSDASGIDFTRHADRKSLTQALAALTDLGAVNLVDPGTGGDAWVERGTTQNGEGNRLFEFTGLVAYLIAPVTPGEPTPPQRAARALLTGPSLSRARDPEAYLSCEQGAQNRLESAFGWNIDMQGDHAALLRDTQPERSGQRVPQGRKARSAAGLLLAGAVRQMDGNEPFERDERGRILISNGQLYNLMDTVRSDSRHLWGQFGQKSTERHLAEVLEDWRTLGALSNWPGVQDGVALEPHLARFRVAYREHKTATGHRTSAVSATRNTKETP